MNIKCIVKDCQNHKHEGGFTGDLCNPCYRFITTNEANNSQAYRNAKLAKTLTDKEISKIVYDTQSRMQAEIEALKADLLKYDRLAWDDLKKAQE